MTNLGTAGATEALAIAADDLWEVRAGVTFPGAYALMAQAYFDQFGGEHEDLAHIAVKNHANALTNEKAQYQSAIEVSDVLEAPPVSEPLGLYDACPISDGAAALVLTSESYAEEHDLEAPVAITGTGQGGDRMALHDREHLARSPAAREAGEEAYADAGVDAGDVDLAEVHDCFTIAEVLALEALDLEPIGEGISAARDGRTTADGETPINLSGAQGQGSSRRRDRRVPDRRSHRSPGRRASQQRTRRRRDDWRRPQRRRHGRQRDRSRSGGDGSMSDAESVADAGFDEWLDAAEDGEAYALECANGHGSLPPRRVCPDCGSTDLEEVALPETGAVQTFTVTHVPTPAFEEDAPYATAIADFGSVGITGQVIGVDPGDVETGMTVELEITVSETTGERVIGFQPV